MPLVLRELPGYSEGLMDWMVAVEGVLGRNPKTGIEIGTYRGESSNIISERCEHLICVDAYTPYEQLKNARDLRVARKIFLDMLKEKNNISFLHMTSKDASEILTGRYDFIYIDGDHSYEGVKKDIKLWRDKALVLGGHDYGDPGFKGLRKAVDELAGNKKILTFQDTSWMYI